MSDLQEPYFFSDKKRDNCCLRGFKELFESSLLFDVKICVEGKQFPSHRAMLAASSDYFRAMFTTDLAERDQTEINISGVDATSVELVIKYLYTGEVELKSDTVQNLLSAANLFQLTDLRDGCASFMAKKLDVENCIGIHFFAQAHDCDNLEFQAWDVITDNFDSVSSTTEFLELSHENLIEIIKYDDIQATEEEMFEAALRWLKYNSERTQYIYNVFSHIRFNLIDEYYFYDKVKNSIMFQGDPRMHTIFDEVVRHKLLKNRWMETDLRLEPRYGSDFCRVIVYTSYCDDDKKQVLQLYGQRSDEVTSRSGNILCDLPCDIEKPAVLVTGYNDLYIAGGEGNGTAMFKWCPEDSSWEGLSVLPEPRKQFCLVQVDKYLLSVGGSGENGNLATVTRYHEDEDEWEKLTPMPKALRCFCAVAYHGQLFVFGGEYEKITKKVMRGKKELNRHTFCYDPREDKWSPLADMPTARALAGCTVYKNKIYVIGGFGSITDSWIKDKSPENCLPSVEIYDPEANSWESGPDLPSPLCSMGVVKYYGTIYVLGGENEEGVSSCVLYLNTENNRWEHKDEMVAGVTETAIHSCYAVMDLDME